MAPSYVLPMPCRIFLFPCGHLGKGTDLSADRDAMGDKELRESGGA